jgi:putative spermidine/putrescine transport system permease protein
MLSRFAALPLWSTVASVYLFLLAPFLVVAIASLEGSRSFVFNFPPRQISPAWYWQIPAKYFQAFGISLVVAAVTSAFAGLIGTAAALGIVRARIPGKNLIQAFFRLPLQIPFVVTGVVFLQFYYRLVDVVGLNLAGSFAGLIVAHVFVTIPYCVGTVSSVLVRLNPRLEEAAESLGASRWSTFRRVTFPLIRPGIFAGILYAFIISFGDVPVAVFLGGGDFVTLPVEIFQSLQFDFDPAILALSTLVVIFSLVLIVTVQRVVGMDVVLHTGRRD